MKPIKAISILLGVAAMTAGSGSLQAKTINADAGPIFSKFFAKAQCQRAASKLRGKWTGRYWTKPGTIDGVCQITIPDPIPSVKPIKRTPHKPSVKLLSVDAGRLWNKAHADTRCPQLAKENRGRWNGKWSEKTATDPSYCQVEITVKPSIAKSTYKILNVNAGRIWSQEHAEEQCPKVAKKNIGTWTGKWVDKGKNSKCQIKITTKKPKVAIKPLVKPKKTKRIREVSAGVIWNQVQANRKCQRVARQVNAEWTGKWRKTGSNSEAVCEMKFSKSGHVPKTRPQQANPRTREVAAGPIWDQAQANKKCPIIAAQTHSNWTGKWRKTNFSTNQSVCEVTLDSVTTPLPTEAVVSTSTTYVNLPSATKNIREVFAGPIWGDEQAATKCPVIATNNNGTWTGKWRKTGANHSSVCEVSF